MTLEEKEIELAKLIGRMYLVERRRGQLGFFDLIKAGQYLREYADIISKKICEKTLDKNN